MEASWKEEKTALKDMVVAMETEKTAQIQQVSSALNQYEGAYKNLASQYTTLQQQYAQVSYEIPIHCHLLQPVIRSR